MTKKKSIVLNAFLSILNSLMSILFPIITFPYITKIFTVECLGQFNFAKNFVDIFCIFAFFGIPTYAIREGAKVRNNQKRIEQLLSELFSIGLAISLIVSSITILLAIFIPFLNSYLYLIFIFVLIIPLKMIGQEWIYYIYEDFKIISFISIGANILSIILMLLFVKTADDVYKYAIILVLATGGANILLFILARKYCKISVTFATNLKKHIKPILILFSTYVSIIIYNKTDLALLGVMCTDYDVGIYSVSSKIYTMVKTCLLALTGVLQARAVIYISENNNSKIKEFLDNCFNMMLTILVPGILGLIFASHDIIEVISSPDYLNASNSLIILSFALFFSLFSTMQSSCILIPNKNEYITLKGTIIGAGVNLILNLILIYSWKEVGAAIATVVAEITVFIYYLKYTKKYYMYDNLRRFFLIFCCGFIVILVIYLSNAIFEDLYIRLFFEIILSLILYLFVIIITNNQLLTFFKGIK